MSTVRDLISGSLRLIGAIASGETPTAAELSDAVTALNDMLDSWSNENLIIYSKARDTFAISPSKQMYTMGPTGDWVSLRPLKIENAAIEQPGANPIEIPIEIINQDQWAQIGIKNTQSTIPRKLYLDETLPAASVYLWPVPSEAKNAIIYSWKPLTNFANANAALTLPPGYSRALRYNLAIELAPEFGKAVSDEVATRATEAKENIKRMNSKTHILECDAAALGVRSTFNWLTGE